jgi:hypothetical protein
MGYTQKGDLVALFDPELARRTVRLMAERGGEALLVRVTDNTPVSYHGLALQYGGFGHELQRAPGTLKRSWRKHPAEPSHDRVNGGWRVEVDSSDPIAAYVEWDTRPHVIMPKLPGGRLRFRTWPTGEVVYAKVVHHPGTTGQHMMGLAVHAIQLGFEEIVSPELHEWARRAEAKA